MHHRRVRSRLRLMADRLRFEAGRNSETSNLPASNLYLPTAYLPPSTSTFLLASSLSPSASNIPTPAA
jgi:hypothetical protein